MQSRYKNFKKTLDKWFELRYTNHKSNTVD